jgi:hypothetical protein
MRRLAWIAVLVSALDVLSLASSSPQPPQSGEELQITDILVGAKKNVENFRPAILQPDTLWNVEQLYLQPASGTPGGTKP